MNYKNYKRPLPLWVAYILFLPIVLPYWIIISVWRRIHKIIDKKQLEDE